MGSKFQDFSWLIMSCNVMLKIYISKDNQDGLDFLLIH